jgi:hypothetical protein|tara:strand:+ start:453 stop:683 length:231 start_codon:yes stop_codon:yes gene_type:complete
MLNELDDVKSFIIWCKNNKVKSFRSKELEFELSDIGLVEGLANVEELQKHLDESKHENEQIQKQEDDELMFWSSNT